MLFQRMISAYGKQLLKVRNTIREVTIFLSAK